MIVSIWQPSLIDAHTFIRDNDLEDFFVQFLPDQEMKRGYWIVFNRMPGPTFADLLRKYTKPKMSYI